MTKKTTTQNLWSVQTRKPNHLCSNWPRMVKPSSMTAGAPILCPRFVHLGTNQRKSKCSPSESCKTPHFYLASLQLPHGNNLRAESAPETFLSCEDFPLPSCLRASKKHERWRLTPLLQPALHAWSPRVLICLGQRWSSLEWKTEIHLPNHWGI